MKKIQNIYLKITCFFYVFIFSILTASVQAKNEYILTATPEWVNISTYNALKQSNDSQANQYLLVDRQLNTVSSNHHYYHRTVTRPLNSTGVGDASEIQIEFNPAFENLNIHSVYVTRENNKQDVTKTASIKVIQREDQLEDKIQNGVLTALITLNDVRVGDIIDYDFSVIGQNPIFGDKVFGRIPLSWSVAVDKQLFTLISTHSNIPFKFHKTQGEIKKTSLQDSTIYQFTSSNTPSVFYEENYPHGITPYAWLEFSEYKNWEEVNTWASSLYAFDNYELESLKEVVSSFNTQEISLDDYIHKSIDFVQNDIRYLGLEFGENAYLPRSPKEVIQKRFGDCKDKSVLLTSLLNEKGLKSYPALVSTKSRREIKDMLPSPGVFDHVITQLEYNDKKYWIDGTATYQEGHLSNFGSTDYGYALTVGNGAQELVAMYPEAKPKSNITVNEKVITHNFDEPVEYTITTEYSNSAAEYQRYIFSNTPIDELQRKYTQYYAQFFTKISAKEILNYTDDPENNRFTITESYAIPEYWDRNGGQVTSSIKLAIFDTYVSTPNTPHRYLDFYIGGLVDIDLHYQLYFPEDVLLNLPEKTLNIKHPAFIYNREEDYNNGLYSIHAHYTQVQDRVSPQNLTTYNKNLQELKTEWSFRLTVDDPAQYPGFREVLTLKRAVKAMEESL